MRWAQFPLLEGAGIYIIGWDLIWGVISRRYGFKNGLLSVLFIGGSGGDGRGGGVLARRDLGLLLFAVICSCEVCTRWSLTHNCV